MPNQVRQKIVRGLKRVVIKIGSSVLAVRENGRPDPTQGLNPDKVRDFAKQVQRIVDGGTQVILVSSGAIMAGRERLGLTRTHLTIPEKQACAAIGQSHLMHAYEKKFDKLGLKVAQILLSSGDLANRKRYLNAKHTVEALLKHKVIPIINENDSVTVDEIKIGDNDTLSATVACLADAELLIILSDVDGLYSRNPSLKPGRNDGEPPERIAHVDRVTEKIEKLAGKSGSSVTVGGMVTKVMAAKKTMHFGIPTLLANGLDSKVMDRVFAGEAVGTLFWSGKEKIRNRKHWIAHTLKPSGVLTVDAGARKALLEGRKSLLPAGVVGVKGAFEFGNAVSIQDEAGAEIGRGLVNYNTADLEQIRGLKTTEVRKLFPRNFYEEVIHRDDLVILDP